MRSTPCMLAPFHSNLRRQTGSAHELIMAGGGSAALGFVRVLRRGPVPGCVPARGVRVANDTCVERRWTDRRTGAGRDRERALIKLAQLKMENELAGEHASPFYRSRQSDEHARAQRLHTRLANALGRLVPRPRAILVISAHWFIEANPPRSPPWHGQEPSMTSSAFRNPCSTFNILPPGRRKSRRRSSTR